MKILQFMAFALIATSGLCGCAWVTAVPVSSDDQKTPGLRVPRSRPILVVAGGNVSVIMIADNNHLVALRWGTFLAKHKVTAAFGTNGLTQIESDADTTAVVISALNFITEAAKQALSGGLLSGNTAPIGGQISLQIFDVDFDSAGRIRLLPLLQPETPFVSVSIQPNSGAISFLPGVNSNPSPGTGTPNPAAATPGNSQAGSTPGGRATGANSGTSGETRTPAPSRQ